MNGETNMIAEWTALPAMPDGVRAYLRDLRIGQKHTYTAFAKQIGLSRRALVGWEMGETEELKQGPLLRALTILQASIDHLKQLTGPDADVEMGRRLAIERLAVILPEDRLGQARKAIQQARQRGHRSSRNGNRAQR